MRQRAQRQADELARAAQREDQVRREERDRIGDELHGSLVRDLTTFEHTVAVMQTREQLRRVAREWVEDLAADGVVYGEARWAPEQHTRLGLSLADAVEAVGAGLADGMAAATASGRPMVARQLVTSLRHTPPNPEVVELAGKTVGVPIARPRSVLGLWFSASSSRTCRVVVASR